MEWPYQGTTYREIDGKAKDEHAKDEANNDANAGGKVLGDVVGVADAERREDAADSLEDDGKPHNAVIAVEESVLGNLVAIVDDDPNKKGRQE